VAVPTLFSVGHWEDLTHSGKNGESDSASGTFSWPVHLPSGPFFDVTSIAQGDGNHPYA